MAKAIVINEAVWPKAGCLMVVFPDQESRDRFIKATFKFLVNKKVFREGQVSDYLSEDKSLKPDVYEDNGEHRVFLDIFQPPKLALKKFKELPSRSKDLDPLNSSHETKLLVFPRDIRTFSVKVSRVSRRTREHHGVANKN